MLNQSKEAYVAKPLHEQFERATTEKHIAILALLRKGVLKWTLND